MRRGLLLLAAAGVLALPRQGHATLFCTEPAVPHCLQYGSGFSSRSDFEDCKWEVEQSVSDSERYVESLQREINETVQRTNDAVETFNCYARADMFC